MRARWGALVAVALLAAACDRGDGRPPVLGLRWRVRMSGGAVDQTLDLSGARLAAVDLVAGVSTLVLDRG